MSQFFTLQSLSFNKKTDFFFSKFKECETDFFFITDTDYHYKNLNYFNKNQIFTIGLIGINLNPFLVNYCIPIFVNNNVTQLFFLNFIIFFKKFSLKTKYKNFFFL